MSKVDAMNISDEETELDFRKEEDVPTSMDEENEEKEEKDISGDGGVTKKILKKGSGWKTPTKGSEVTVHYVGRLLDGSVFDSSRDRDEPFKFFLGKGQVIKGWDLGVEQMKKGEVAILTCKPEYAYGASGQPPKIPPNSTLAFEVELISWMEETDVSEAKDKSILKKTLKEGTDWETPRDEYVVKIKYTATLPNGTIFDSSDGLEFVMGEDHMIEGLEKALESMKKSEQALITIKPQHAFGSAGDSSKGVPPDTTVQYNVELLDMKGPKKKWDMNTEEKFEFAEKRRLQGNEFYQKKKFKIAGKKYRSALEIFEYDYDLKDDEKARAKKEIKLPCYLNLAACKLQTKEYKDVLENCKKALEIDPNNLKALMRRGKAYSEQLEWELAAKEFERCREISPDDKDVAREIALLKRNVAEHERKDKKRYANMFQRLDSMDDK